MEHAARRGPDTVLKPELCLVMPAYNEQDCIEKVITGWLASLERRFLPDRTALIVVNDGSRDQTGQILDSLASRHKSLVVLHQENSGHGRALLRAYRQALQLSPEWVFHVDSDDQFQPSDFGLLWSRRAESRFIIGRRKSRRDAFHRLLITRTVRFLNFLLFGCFVWDANVPYRLIQGVYLERLLQVLPPAIFAPNIFLSVLAAKDGQKLLEVPIGHRPRKTGSVSIVRWKLIKACLRSAHELFLFRLSLASRLQSLKNESGMRTEGAG